MMKSIALGTKSSVKVLYLFSTAPGKSLTRKEIQQMTRLANNPLSESLKFLVNSGILARKNKREYALDFDNEDVAGLVEFFKDESRHLRNIPYTIWLTLFELSVKVAGRIPVKSIYLFGSQAKLVAHEKSDIDVAVVVVGGKREAKMDLELEKIASRLENKFGRKIQVHVFEEKEFARHGASMSKEILRDGIRII